MDRRLKKIVDIVQEMMAGNAVGASGGFGGKADSSGPVAGYDKPLKKKRKPTPIGRYGSRKPWLDHVRNSKTKGS